MFLLLSALAGYLLASAWLLRHPGTIHRKRRLPFRPRHISHRGGAGERVENTMEAFRHAAHCGTDMLELDCALTRDGEVVVTHDVDLHRQTGVRARVGELDYKDLPLYLERIEVEFYPGHYSTGTDRRIARLEEVFQNFPRLPVNVEIKENNRQLIRKVSDLVKRFDREPITIWASESQEIMERCHTENPSMPRAFTRRSALLLLLAFHTGILPFLPLQQSCLECPMPSIIGRYYHPTQSLLRSPLVVRVLDWLLMQKSLIKHLEDRGIQVYLWTLNEECDYQRAFQLGATGVMTDFPSKLQGFLEQAGEPCPPRT